MKNYLTMALLTVVVSLTYTGIAQFLPQLENHPPAVVEMGSNIGPEDLAPDQRHHSLDKFKDIILADKRHLDVDLRVLGLTIGPLVLVAQRSGQLEIAIKTGGHECLLVKLG